MAKVLQSRQRQRMSRNKNTMADRNSHHLLLPRSHTTCCCLDRMAMGRWTRVRTLGRSASSAEVFLAADHDSGAVFAVKVAKKDLSPVDHTFEFHLSAEMNFGLHAVVVFTEAEAEEEGLRVRYDDNMFHHFNKLELEGVIVELVASMIFRGTATNSSINHQAVVLLENIQPEADDDDDEAEAEEELEIVEPVASMTLQEISNLSINHQAVVHLDLENIQLEADVDAETKVQHKMQSSERPSKIDEIKKLSCTWACQSILQVIYGNVDMTADQLKHHIKLLSSYSLKSLWFAIPLFYASLSHHSSTSKGFSVGDALFLVAIITDAALILLLPTLGNALVCISWLLLELATCVLILSFNKHYAFAILAALLLVLVVALLQPKLQHAADRHVLPSFTQDMIGDDEESQHLGHLLELSQGIASFGGLFTAIAQRFMVGPVNAVGFIFFCAIALGLYLSMVVTVGAVSHAHAKCLAILVMVLVVLTFITACIPFAGHSGSMLV